MAITLAQAKLNTQDDIQAGVIDEFRKSSFILDNITFDDAELMEQLLPMDIRGL